MRYVNMLKTEPNQISISKLLEAFDPKNRTYTVQAGDTLSTIAVRLNIWYNLDIEWEDLARLNALENPDLILEGQVLKIFE